MELDAPISTLCNSPSCFMILVEALSFSLLSLGPISFKSTLRCEEFLNIMKHVNIDQWGFSHQLGFSRYSGFMHLECYHTHPCMQTFVLILTQCRLDTQQKLLGSSAVASTDQSTGQYLMTLAMSLLGLERTRSNKVSSEGQAQADDITDGQAERETRPVQMKEHTWYLENPKGLELVARNNRNSQAPQSTINGPESLGQCVGAETNMAMYDVSMSSAVEAAGSIQCGSGDSDPWGDLRGGRFEYDILWCFVYYGMCVSEPEFVWVFQRPRQN